MPRHGSHYGEGPGQPDLTLTSRELGSVGAHRKPATPTPHRGKIVAGALAVGAVALVTQFVTLPAGEQTHAANALNDIAAPHTPGELGSWSDPHTGAMAPADPRQIAGSAVALTPTGQTDPITASPASAAAPAPVHSATGSSSGGPGTAGTGAGSSSSATSSSQRSSTGGNAPSASGSSAGGPTSSSTGSSSGSAPSSSGSSTAPSQTSSTPPSSSQSSSQPPTSTRSGGSSGGSSPTGSLPIVGGLVNTAGQTLGLG